MRQILSIGCIAAVTLATSFVAAQEPRPPQDVEVPPGDVLVATVNGEAITRNEIHAALEPQVQGRQVEPEQLEQLRNRVLDDLITSRLLEQYAIDQGPDVEKQEVEEVLARAKEQIEAQGIEFDQFLVSRGYTHASVKDRIKGSIAWQKFQQQQLTEENLQQHYAAHRDRFQGEEYEAVRNRLAQSYLQQLRNEIVQRTLPNAEITVMETPPPEGGRPAPANPPTPQR